MGSFLCQISHYSVSAVEKLALPPSETQPSNIWLIVGVVVPVLVVILIIIILYWKLCRSEKLEFQPDAMSTIQQRQKVWVSECVSVWMCCPLIDTTCEGGSWLCSLLLTHVKGFYGKMSYIATVNLAGCIIFTVHSCVFVILVAASQR